MRPKEVTDQSLTPAVNTWPYHRKLTLISVNGVSRFVWLTYPRPRVSAEWLADVFVVRRGEGLRVS
jgi:hypothetical protein